QRRAGASDVATPGLGTRRFAFRTLECAVAKPQHDPRTDPDVPPGMSIELLQDLHLLTRDRQLNADARRKLKQIRHLVGLLKPALDDALERHPGATIVDCGAGKSALGFLLYELVLGPRGRGTLFAVESREELVASAAARAARYGHRPLPCLGRRH